MQVFQEELGLYPGDSAMFINGLQADLDVYDVFTLVETLMNEAKLMEGMHDIAQQVNKQFFKQWLYSPLCIVQDQSYHSDGEI